MTAIRWQKLTEWPLVGASLGFIVAYTWQVAAAPAAFVNDILNAIIWITWAMFAVDYVVSLVLAERRWQWFVRHLLDLAIVLLPLLRPLRLLRVLALVAVIRRATGSALRGRVIIYVTGSAVLLVYIAALLMLEAEGSEGSIQTIGQGLWWAFVTITTVGYGDYAPVTPMGQMVAVAVMIGGIALIGVVTATLASWIVERVSDETEADQVATKAQISALTDEIAALRADLARDRDGRSADGPNSADRGDLGDQAGVERFVRVSAEKGE